MIGSTKAIVEAWCDAIRWRLDWKACAMAIEATIR